MRFLYKIRLDIHYDAWNWWDACNSNSHGIFWKDYVDENLANKLIGKTQKEANKYILPFLKKVYVAQAKNIGMTKKFFKNEFDQKFQDGCNKIVKTMTKPLYRKDFTIYLTTLRRGPYYKAKGLVWICIDWTDPIKYFLHELCHFQFIHYWRENPNSAVEKLSDEQFEFLKESLTIILDKDFMPIINQPDQGYELHKNFRKELAKYWQKNKNFDQLVDFGVGIVRHYNLATGRKNKS